ncbi:MAG: lactate utilization protein [Thermoplasmata archaeon]|nr:lactate utilization protein [Thermoplasmata archaeon]
MEDLITLFKNSIEENGGFFKFVNRIELINEIKKISKGNEIMFAGLDESIENEIIGSDIKSISLDKMKDDRDLKNKIKNINIGITDADALAAESGSIILVDYNYMKSFAAFLPEIHIAIAYPEKIFPGLIEALDYIINSMNELPATIQIIQGPSKTGDIEKKIVRPSHGPKELYVFLIR